MSTLDEILDKLDTKLEPVRYPDGTKYADEIVITGKKQLKASLIEYIDKEIIGEDDVNTTTSNIKELEKDVRNELRAEQRAKLKEQL